MKSEFRNSKSDGEPKAEILKRAGSGPSTSHYQESTGVDYLPCRTCSADSAQSWPQGVKQFVAHPKDGRKAIREKHFRVSKHVKRDLLEASVGGAVWVVVTGTGGYHRLVAVGEPSRISPDRRDFLITWAKCFEFEPPYRPRELDELGWFPLLVKEQKQFKSEFARIRNRNVIRSLERFLKDEGAACRQRANDEFPLTPDGMVVEKESPPSRIAQTVNRITRDTAAAKSLKGLYQHRCQVCGFQIPVSRGEYYIEVHHVRPLGGEHRGHDEHSNMLVLCPNHHAMFDLWLPEFLGTDRIRINGDEFRLEVKHRLSPAVIAYYAKQRNARH
jgi:hypothetical protein